MSGWITLNGPQKNKKSTMAFTANLSYDGLQTSTDYFTILTDDGSSWFINGIEVSDVDYILDGTGVTDIKIEATTTDFTLIYLQSLLNGDIGEFKEITSVDDFNCAGSQLTGDVGQLEDVDFTHTISLDSTNITACSSVNMFPNAVEVIFYGCDIDETGIDNILQSVVNGNVDNGTMILSGGTNAVPSSAGLANKTILEGRGWYVSINT